MPTFNFVARQATTGQQILNSVDATTQEEAIVALLKRDLLVVAIEQKLPKKVETHAGRVDLKDLVAFTRQFATIVDAGMAILSCLRGLARQTRSKAMASVVNDLCARIERGDSLSDAMSKHPKVFSKLYLSMVIAGEKGGLLAEILARLATYLENMARLRRKVKSALMYPVLVTIVAIAITMLLLVKVVPVFASIFDSFKGKLPAPTLYLMEVSDFVQAWLFPILLLMAAAVYGWILFVKTAVGREFWDTLRIKLPVFGHIVHTICLSRFARTFSSLVSSGVPIIEVLETAARACGNVAMEKAVLAAAKDIEHGQPISDALAKNPIFPDMFSRMLSAGEQTGKIDEVLERMADHLDEEVETLLSGLTALIEPALIVFLGVFIGGIVICMFLPIFKLPSIVSGN